ncbi:peptidoglycan DD-metalloendopeptidase family protein [Microbacterium sp. NPDC087868]|uniref:peptidoglycan DD-metalloendopeptidase family protein n=1 Tax=Microbacterium sp. NPDC087868 TaxID=3364195 RepID=UPI00384F0973
MKRQSRLRRARVGVLALLAVVLASFFPSLTSSAPASAATDGQMVVPSSGNIQSKVGDGCRNNYRKHDGIDIGGGGGTPILAAYDGVIKARTANSGYGNYVDIEHPGGYVTRYGHMAAPGMQAAGTRVSRGQQIGVVGKTGATDAYHLHFEVWRNGSVYSAINNGFTCLTNVTRGSFIPMNFPGLGTPVNPKVLTADYNRDGKADLVGVAADGDLHFLGGNGTAALKPRVVITSGWAGRGQIAHGDLNNDGHSDLIVVRNDGTLEFYGGSPAAGGGFASQRDIATGWGGLLHLISGADYTGDGLHDVISVRPDGNMTIHLGDGKGGLSGQTRPGGPEWNSMVYLVGGDFDRDGRGDLIAIDAAGIQYFYPGIPNGFAARQIVGRGWTGFTAMTGGVDYNGDGRPDLVARMANGDLRVYPGGGNGGFGASYVIGTGFGSYLQIE